MNRLCVCVCVCVCVRVCVWCEQREGFDAFCASTGRNRAQVAVTRRDLRRDDPRPAAGGGGGACDSRVSIRRPRDVRAGEAGRARLAKR